MKVAVIGAGIAGVATAHELAVAGHRVCVFERRGGVAAEASFGTNGVLSPALRAPWATRSLPRPPWRSLPTLGTWWLRARRAAAAGSASDEAFWALARRSIERLAHWRSRWPAEYERTDGVLYLWRESSAFELALAACDRLRAAGVRVNALDAEACRRLESGLSATAAISGGLLLPQAEAGNCRLAAHLWRDAAEQLGAEFRFGTVVRAIDAGKSDATLRFEQLALTTGFAPTREGGETPRGRANGSSTDDRSAAQALLRQRALAAARYLAPVGSETFDAVVICAGTEAAALLAPLGLRLPLQTQTGQSLTLPLRSPERGPRSALVDVERDTTLTRLGERVRVSGGAELGPVRKQPSERGMQSLYRALDTWVPGCAHLSRPQAWHAARACLPDGLPMIGAVPGHASLWLNIAHGNAGWTLAAGSALRIAEALDGRDTTDPGTDFFAPTAARF
ncbi:MAG: hypothetical protein RLZZ598_610 [Pseudomonadota bacterium]|jgi:D-amino-acid dehydrogenase